MIDMVLRLAKILLLAMLAVLFVGILNGSPRQVDFSVLQEELQGAMDLSGMKQADAQLLRRLYGLNGGELKSWVLWTAEDNMAVEELLLAECASTEQAELVRQAAEKRVDTQKQSFEGYGPEQVQLLNDSVIQVEDTYVLFAVTDQAQEVKDVFLKALYPGILP